MTLRGLPLALQAALCDGLAFDPFSLQQDCLAASKVKYTTTIVTRRSAIFSSAGVRLSMLSGSDSGWPRLSRPPEGLGLDWPEHGGMHERIGLQALATL